MANARQNVAVWFEIPAADFDRAAQFYENVMEVTLRRETMGPQKMGVFPYPEDTISGCILAGPDAKPADSGTILYINADGRLDAALGRVAAAGGAVMTPIIRLPGDMGRFAHIRDTEGNRVGLHARD